MIGFQQIEPGQYTQLFDLVQVGEGIVSVKLKAGFVLRNSAQGFVTGFVPVTGVDADHDIELGTGSARDALNEVLLVLGSAMVKRIDASWTAGTNQGGMFPGVSLVANGIYYPILIKDDSDDSIDWGFDSDIDGFHRPAGHTVWRRLPFEVYTDDSSNILHA